MLTRRLLTPNVSVAFNYYKRPPQTATSVHQYLRRNLGFREYSIAAPSIGQRRKGTDAVLATAFQLLSTRAITIMGNRHQRVIDGVEYNIRQDMVRFRKQTWKEWFARKVLAKYIGIPFMSLLAPLWYILVANFGWARELMSSVTWIFMPWLDLSLADVKQELTKDIAGKRVLDVGAGSGDWLRFLEGAESVTELEPDGHRLRILRKTVDEYRSSHPAANIDVAHTTLAKLDVKDPFDVVILANTLCEVADTRAFLAQVDRVLKPGGKVIFQEHIHQPSGTMGGVAQSIFNFLWRRANKGAEVNKDPVELLKATGKWHVEAWDLKVDGALIFDRVAVGVASKSKIP